MRRKILRGFVILAIALLLPSVFLSACGPEETEQFVYWATLWAKANNIIDEDEKPDYGVAFRFIAGQAFGLGSAGDEEADAAIDGAGVLKRIRQAEESAGRGWEALEAGGDTGPEVMPHFDKAIDLRPEDWSYRNARASASLEDIENPDGAKDARGDFDKAKALAEKSGRPEEYLRMLRDRVQVLARLIAVDKGRNIYPARETLEERSRACDELYRLTGGEEYLLLKEQADDSLRQGHYRQRS